MKRNYIYAFLLTLLIMLPIGLSAQSVTGMQYWFDDGSKHTTSISEGGNNLSLSTDGLSVGMHTLYPEWGRHRLGGRYHRCGDR